MTKHHPNTTLDAIGARYVVIAPPEWPDALWVRRTGPDRWRCELHCDGRMLVERQLEDARLTVGQVRQRLLASLALSPNDKPAPVMKRWRLRVEYRIAGYVTVEAETEKQARAYALEDGIDALSHQDDDEVDICWVDDLGPVKAKRSKQAPAEPQAPSNQLTLWGGEVTA